MFVSNGQLMPHLPGDFRDFGQNEWLRIHVDAEGGRYAAAELSVFESWWPQVPSDAPVQINSRRTLELGR